MLRKISALLIVFVIIAISSAGVFAGNPEDTGTSKGSVSDESTASGKSAAEAKKPDFEAVIQNAMKNGSAVNNGQFIMTLNSPDKDKNSTYEQSYVLSGSSEYSDVVITIARYNEETGQYERMLNTDGESTWEIGYFRMFSKEIKLTTGANKIMIMSYRSTQKEEATLDNTQINCFTIERLDKSIAEQAVKKTKETVINISKDIGEGIKSVIDFFGKK